jgi:hypothetical protein
MEGQVLLGAVARSVAEEMRAVSRTETRVVGTPSMFVLSKGISGHLVKVDLLKARNGGKVPQVALPNPLSVRNGKLAVFL